MAANPLVSTENRPEVTTAQRLALLAGGIPIAATLLRVFGVYDLNPEQLGALNDAVQYGSLLAGALILGDAGLRVGRNVADSKVNAAAVTGGAAELDDEPDPDEPLPADADEFAAGTGPDDE